VIIAKSLYLIHHITLVPLMYDYFLVPDQKEVLSLRDDLEALADRVKNHDRRLDAVEEQVVENDARLDYVCTSIRQDRTMDIYTFADQAERMDFASNLLKANCVLLTGR
jgi:hypothetical protein